ncbi:MAG: diguanylate cyclase [Gammaproteobacteria bacterium]|nr:diguanylate cyclase [Gammaproteobacteria bacterium]
MKHLLIVEDNKIAGSLISTKVSHALPLKIHWAQSLAEARELLDKNNNDFFAALLDYVLPDAQDGEVIDEVVNRGIPSIVFTGNVLTQKERLRLWRKNIVDYVVKDDPQSLEYLTFLLTRLDKNPGIKIMIVDDSKFFRVVLSRLLRVHRYNVLEAVDGPSALNALEHTPDVSLVITDYSMPGMDGFTFIKRIRKRYGREGIAILGMTSERDKNMGARFIKCGANDFISKKNFITEELYCRVNQNLESLEHVQTIRRLATTDSLTGLYNRRYFYDTATHLLAGARRSNTGVACAMIDIDRFKIINDTWGHQIGDFALQQISDILSSYFKRDSDLVARMGGEEFCVLANDISPSNALKRFEEVRHLIEAKPLDIDEFQQHTVTVSIGVSTHAQAKLDHMLRKADELLYKAKTSGRNQVCADIDT